MKENDSEREKRTIRGIGNGVKEEERNEKNTRNRTENRKKGKE